MNENSRTEKTFLDKLRTNGIINNNVSKDLNSIEENTLPAEDSSNIQKKYSKYTKF